MNNLKNNPRLLAIIALVAIAIIGFWMTQKSSDNNTVDTSESILSYTTDEETGETLGDNIDQMKDSVDSAVENTSEMIDDAVEATEDATEEAVDSISETVEDIKTEMEAPVEEEPASTEVETDSDVSNQ